MNYKVFHNKGWKSETDIYSPEKVLELKNLFENFKKNKVKYNSLDTTNLKGIGFYSGARYFYGDEKREELSFMIDPYLLNSQKLIPLNPSKNSTSGAMINNMILSFSKLELIYNYSVKKKRGGFLNLGKVISEGKGKYEDIRVISDELGEELNTKVVLVGLEQIIYPLYDKDYGRIRNLIEE